jgi:NAD dependent epimerase/dehydratase family enzyme
VSWIIQNEAARGPVNATGPNPVTNTEFARALGHAIKRPSVLPAPGFALRILLGEMADALLLSGQRALPVRATDLGFSFRFGNVDEALADIFHRGHFQ